MFFFRRIAPADALRLAEDTATRMPSSPRRGGGSRMIGSLLGVVAFVLGLMAASPARAQITTNTALPVARGEGIVRLQSKIMRATGDPTPMNREVEVTAFPLVGVYGVTPKLALFGVVPILDKSLDVTTPEGRINRSTRGVGDIRLFARYTAYQLNRPGQTIRLATFAGLEAPTGEDGKSDAVGRLPQPLQLGSGSWDPFAGVVFTWQTLNWQFDASPAYKVNTEANDFRFGDEARLDVSYKYRVLPRTLGGGLPSFLYAVLETNLIWQDQNETGGAVDANSGGTTWYLVPGLQYITKRIILEAAVQLPVVQDLNGSALENDFILTLSARFSI